MKKYIVFLLFFILSETYAATDCGPYKVTMIQSQTTDLLVLFKNSNDLEIWKNIGFWSNSSTKPYLGLLMQAYAMKKNIQIRYEKDNYSCDQTDYLTIPSMVRIF